MTRSAVAPALPERYADAQLVARGGMGEVWKASDQLLDRPVAVKLLRVDTDRESAETMRARFEREATAVARLSSHWSVVTVYDVDETSDGVPFMTMQWLDGGSLSSIGDVRETDALRWLAQVAGALDAAHAAGIVHRDVKPGNVLLDEHGDAHIGDFGIASVDDVHGAGLTMAGSVVGTASYMSPEQATGTPATARSDQYALAVIAYELLTARRPHERESAVAELTATVSEPVPPASELQPRLTAAVDEVFERALAKDPAARYPNCSAFVQALRCALEQLPETVPVAVAAPAATLAATPTPIPAREERPLRRAASPPWWRSPLVLGIAALVLIGSALVAFGGPDRDPPARGTQDPAPQATPTTTTTEQQPKTSTPTTAATTQPTDELTRAQAIAMHEQAFRLLQQGRYAEALPLAKRALAALVGVAPYEAYANYNVGAALVGLGRCTEALPYLDRSEQLQGHRREIDEARAQCTGGGKHGKAKGHTSKD